MDIASASFFDGHINWYENVDGKGNVWKNHTIYMGIQGHYVSNADLDGDGDSDLIAVTHAENTVAVYLAHTHCDDPNERENCCLSGTRWNGTTCEPCPWGTYGDDNGGCIACPKDACTIEGHTHLPATCSGVAPCGDLVANAAECSCPEDTMKDPATDVCLACPEGQIRPDVGLQRPPETVGNYTLWEMDQGICYVQRTTDYTPIVVSVSIIGSLLLIGLALLLYRQHQLSVKNNRWKIKEADLVYEKTVLGVGSFGEVRLAEYRGTKVAVKTIKPSLLSNKQPEKSGGDDDDFDDEDYQSSVYNSIQTKSDCFDGEDVESTKHSSGHMDGGGSGTMRMSIKQGNASGRTSLAKTFKMSNGDMRDDFIKEIRLLSQLPEHRNIVCVMGAVMKVGKDPMLVMEYMERGSLSDLLQSDQPIGGQLIQNILQDVTQGMRFLHNCNPRVVHSDLKSSNILIDDRWRAKISDFGWGSAGTPYWTAPEVLKGRTPYTTASDVYAYGITMYEIYARQPPYAGEDISEVLSKIKKKNKRPRAPSTMSQKVAFMFKDCIGRKPGGRPTLNELAARIERLSTEDFDYLTSGNTNDTPVMFPAHVAKALSKGHTVEPDAFRDATVVYCELVDFATLSSKLSPMKLADMMHRLTDRLDTFADQCGVFKEDMMGGGAWMGATNVVQHQPNDHLERVYDFVEKAVEAASVTLIDEDDPDQGYIQLRAAFISGPVNGKVTGVRKPRYTLYGPGVESATLLCQKSEPGTIICAEHDQVKLEQIPKLQHLSFQVMSRVFVPSVQGASTLFRVNNKSK